jgi:signal transduction histidine kinase
LGKRVREIAPQLEKHWFEIYGKVALTGEPIRFENRAEALSRWFDVYAYRVGPPEEHKVAVLFNDITRRKESEQALAKAKNDLEDYARNLEAVVSERTAKLQQTVVDLEMFSFTVSHDLRSPLRSMEGFAHALLEEYSDQLDDQGRQYLERISNAAIRLDKLILEVLTYSQIGRSESSIVQISLDKLMQDVVQTYPEIRAANAEITIEHPLHTVLGAEVSLVQCISNLLSNAVKFVPPGTKAKVRVWTEKRDSAVRLFVADNGIGIPENLQSRIFEPFQRGHPLAGYEGTGMGLAIVRKAIQRMDGSVGVESREGHGSTFWLELPVPPGG